MKKIFDKKTIFVILIAIIIGLGSIAVASTIYQANQVTYKDSNVEDALDELYENNSQVVKGTLGGMIWIRNSDRASTSNSTLKIPTENKKNLKLIHSVNMRMDIHGFIGETSTLIESVSTAGEYVYDVSQYDEINVTIFVPTDGTNFACGSGNYCGAVTVDYELY